MATPKVYADPGATRSGTPRRHPVATGRIVAKTITVTVNQVGGALDRLRHRRRRHRARVRVSRTATRCSRLSRRARRSSPTVTARPTGSAPTVPRGGSRRTPGVARSRTGSGTTYNGRRCGCHGHYSALNRRARPFHRQRRGRQTADAADHATGGLKRPGEGGRQGPGVLRQGEVEARRPDLPARLDSPRRSRPRLLHDPFGNGLAGFDAQVEADTADIDRDGAGAGHPGRRTGWTRSRRSTRQLAAPAWT